MSRKSMSPKGISPGGMSPGVRAASEGGTMQGDGRDSGGGPGAARLGFLAMAFAVVGLTGMLAGHVGRLPLERALAREAVLDEALAAGRAGDTAALEALRVRLGESAAAILPAGDGFDARLAGERVAMRARRMAEAGAIGLRLQVMLVVVTLLAGGFGAMMMLAGRRQGPPGGGRVAGDGKVG